MSHYLSLSDEDKIRLAQEAVQCNVPIAPVIAGWLHENSLHDRVANPRKLNANNETVDGGPPAS